MPVYTGERVAEGDEQHLIMAHLGALERAEWNHVAVQRETALPSRLFELTMPSGYDSASRRWAIRLGWPSDITR